MQTYISSLVSRLSLSKQSYRDFSPAPSPSSGLGVALHHLGFERLPDVAVKRMEGRVGLDLGDVARPRQRHPPVADDARGRSGRHNDDAVGQRDRLLQIVGNEEDGLAVGAPQ